MQILRTKRKLNNVCVACGGKLDREGAYCIACNDKYNKWKHARRIKHHEEGLCTTCGKELDRIGWFCSKCTRNLRMRAKIRCDERRLNSQCVRCGISVTEGSYCRKCLDLRMEMYYRKKGVNHG